MERLHKELINYSHKDYYPFHMPGHKQNKNMVEDDFPFERDITEIEGFDNLHHPEGIIKEAQTALSNLCGSLESYYSINGSTAALLSAISAAVPFGGEILIARNCHKAVYHAVYLRNLNPTYIYPQFDDKWWINGGIMPDKVERILAANSKIKAVLITSPTYDGVVSDVKKIASITHQYGLPLIVDEAHGAHFRFSDYFPVSAGELGADLVIQSFHKTLPSMTQTAVLHRYTDRVESRLISRFLDIYQSSSPSYILMASLDACVEKMSADGKKMFDDFTENLEIIRHRLSSLKYIRLASPETGKNSVYDFDRSKLIFSTVNSSLTGKELAGILMDKYHLPMEMETEFYVLALTAVGDRKYGFDRLCTAIEEIDREEALKAKEKKHTEEEEETHNITQAILKQQMTPAAAMEAPSVICPVEDSIGKISAEFGYLYPPGIPLIVPGEQITGQFVRNMRVYKEKRIRLQGFEDYTNETIRVVKEADKE